MSKSLLVFLKYKDEKPVLKSILGEGEILWSGKNGFEIIGDGKEEWEQVFLIKYPSAISFQNAVEKYNEIDLSNIKIISIKLFSSVKAKLMKFLMKRIFSKMPAKFYQVDKIDYDQLNSPILPTKEQLTRLLSKDIDQPVMMLNLMKYFESAKYPEDYSGKPNSNVSGKKAYNRYGKGVMRVLAKLGGTMEHLGEVKASIIGDIDKEWDAFGLVRYPSRKSFQKMFTLRSKTEENEAIHRDAGLEKTRVIALYPD